MVVGISRGSLHRYLKLGIFRSHSNAIRPSLTDANKYSRMKFAFNFVRANMEFDDMMDYVHLDEKWFYITKTTRRYYLVPGAKEPQRMCKSKRFISKIMFLSAVARPDATGTWWDGKIGTWPFVESVQAQRNSANRAAGTYETKALTVTKDVYRAFLVEKVLPAIVSKWQCPKRLVHLQHDKFARTCDARRREALGSRLGFFAAIQSLQHCTSARTVDDLITNVHAAFDKYPFERLDRTFMTLQACLVETMKCFGDNAYKVPHLSKEKQARLGLLSENFRCPSDTYDSVKRSVDSVDCTVMEKKFQEELDEARSMHELAQELERIALLFCARVFFSLDWFKGYWQLALHEDSQMYYSFMTPFGVYTPTRVLIGQTDAVVFYHLHSLTRIQGLCALAPPTTTADLQQFVCAINWMRSSIPCYTELVVPLRQLLDAATNVVGWDVGHLPCFDKIKESLLTMVSMAHPRVDMMVCLYTDASDSFWGAIATQVPFEDLVLPLEEQRHHPLAFLSGAFTGASERWPIVDKEAFAVVESCKRPQVGALGLVLSSFPYTIGYLSGEDNMWDDLLSRWDAAQAQVSTKSVRCLLAMTGETPPTGVAWNEDKNLFLDKEDRIWIPPSATDLQQRVCIIAHQGAAGHRRIEATTKAVRDGFA
ncbi:hypothetical protein H257_11397 [Aphanomyces astaci]|uniref:Reverse transcriptase/retrotransposon-derived protein RNase H-like domain-containing protein n=1 Tax=Aphanomyces astaci TaxID=112090 RepID=W4G347_APHAT|nr:hypothetical protein H257_11397 [Aphanomyces astaci]ETV74095.1 hypothetical protein H257_11397 [Aphanomyces astaci]|eukprot:XP_009836608.1 hypothetical protein H257_11397 [Aphanomyces astaci]